MNVVLLHPGERRIPLSDVRARHIKKILHATVGDCLRAGVLDGPIGHARIVDWTNDGIDLEFEPECAPPQTVAVDIVLGHPRPIVLRRMIRDLCTVGVRSLQVVPTELGEKSYLRSTMWRDVETPLVEGASQAGTTRLMKVERIDSLSVAVGSISPDARNRIVLHPGPIDGNQSTTTDLPLLTHQAIMERRQLPVVLAIGSERGWTAAELSIFSAAGFTPFELGPRTLRTESAALIAAWIVAQAVELLMSRNGPSPDTLLHAT